MSITCERAKERLTETVGVCAQPSPTLLSCPIPGPEKMKSMSQLAVLTRRWTPAQMKLEPFQEVVLESSSVEELKEKVCVCVFTS